MVVAMSGAAYAGEVKPNGDFTAARSNANSICMYSGLNDDPLGLDPANGPPGRTQTFGQDVRAGFIDPRQFNPGDACQGGSNHNRNK
jgi:hypothetical protein